MAAPLALGSQPASQTLGRAPASSKCRCLIRSITIRHGDAVSYRIAVLELRSLGYFVRIAELGSITRAAAHLRLAQPALTRHVQRLEEELGGALFNPPNRRVRLTAAGEQLPETPSRILREVGRHGDAKPAQDRASDGRLNL